jgi:hypothetical protein
MLRQAGSRTAPWDILSRRTRALLLSTKSAIRMAPRVAALLAKDLGHDAAWMARQVAAFTELARGYQVAPAKCRSLAIGSRRTSRFTGAHFCSSARMRKNPASSPKREMRFTPNHSPDNLSM